MKLCCRFYLAFALIFLVYPVRAFSDEASSELSRADQRLILLEARAKRIKTLQEQIRQKQIEIIKNLDVLEVRIRRS